MVELKRKARWYSDETLRRIHAENQRRCAKFLSKEKRMAHTQIEEAIYFNLKYIFAGDELCKK